MERAKGFRCKFISTDAVKQVLAYLQAAIHDDP